MAIFAAPWSWYDPVSDIQLHSVFSQMLVADKLTYTPVDSPYRWSTAGLKTTLVINALVCHPHSMCVCLRAGDAERGLTGTGILFPFRFPARYSGSGCTLAEIIVRLNLADTSMVEDLAITL